MTEMCEQAWPGGLSDFMWNEAGFNTLIECNRPAHHTGRHRNVDKSMQWWNRKLTEAEMSRANAMREAFTDVIKKAHP